jgi:hypothetical protein
MSFPGGGTRETPEVYQRISRRNFWPGSRRRHGRPLVSTVGDMLWNRIPIRERHKIPIRLPMMRGKWATLWDGAGNRLAPRPEPRRR